jgi:transcriptional regulator with GAF, ATPase, and Fis domain
VQSAKAEVKHEDGATALEEVERQHIESVLRQTNWMIEGERGAAKLLNLNPSTLRSRMQKLEIKRPGKVA